MARRRWTAGLCFVTVVSLGLGLHFAHALFGVFYRHPYDFIDTWLMDGLMVAAAMAAITAVFRRPTDRARRLLTAVGVSSYAAAYVVYHSFLTGSPFTFPQVSDILWLSFYAALAVALGLALRRKLGASRWLWLDAAVNALALVAVGWGLVVAPAAHAAITSEAFVLGSAGYMVGDLILLGLIVALLTARRFRVSPERGAILLGVLILASADIIYAQQAANGVDVTGSVLDPLWVTAMLVVAASSWLPGREGPQGAEGHELRDSAALTTVPPLLALMATIVVFEGAGDTFSRVLALTSVALVCLRLVASLKANRDLLAEVKAGERNYRELVESSQDLIWSVDRDGCVTFVNAAGERMLNRPAGELVGQALSNLMRADDSGRERRVFASVLSGHPLKNHQTKVTLADGRELSLLVQATPRVDAEGNIYGTTGTATDITERVAAERERARLQERARELERFEALGRLAGGVAHDFNNLMAIVLNYAEFLEEQVVEGGAADLAEIKHAAKRATSLTSQLLVISRHNHDERSPMDAVEAIEGFVPSLRRALGDDVELDLQLDERPVIVDLGPGQLDQLVMNLTMNAREAMPRGGVVSLAVEVLGREMCISVEDEGSGISPEVESRMFDPFYTTKPTGTGLGLATVYGIATHAGGGVAVHTAEGRGTRVEVRLPLCDRALPVADAPEQSPNAGGGETILLAEDEPAIRDLVVRVLSKAGYRVLAACSGSGALALAESEEVHLLLTDVVMPGASGPATARSFRASRPDAAVLFMSGYTADAVSRNGLDQLDAALLQKPFTPAALLLAVQQALAREPVGAPN